MKHQLFDLETNGLLDHPDLRIHCLVTVDLDTERMYSYVPPEWVDRVDCEGTIEEGLEVLTRATRLHGHNIAGYDYPVIERLHPEVGARLSSEMLDTLRMSQQMFFSNMMERSARCRNAAGRSEEKREARLPKALLRKHSLEAWGHRLRLQKGEYLKNQGGASPEFTPELLEYCQRDVWINVRLLHYLREHGADFGWPVPSVESMLVESRVAHILGRQERNGVGFDLAEAAGLAAQLSARREELTTELRSTVPPWWAPDGPRGGIVYSKRRNRTKGWGVAPVNDAGRLLSPSDGGSEARTKVKLVEFNPGSGHHIANRLKKLYGWEPGEDDFTPTGQPRTDEETLAHLPYPIIPKLLEWLTVNKRLGQLSEGKQAWLKVEKNGLIHGRVNPTGTRTSRMSHFNPNLAQVPKVSKPYGRECRSLFHPTRPDWVQVGCDASGIELRMLAHRMALYDGGAFAREVVEGDCHAAWQAITGLYSRDYQKTLTYADLYGAGDRKRGLIIIRDWREAYSRGDASTPPPGLEYATDLGKQVKAKLMAQVPALAMVQEACRRAYRSGYILALDGRVNACGAEHATLNDVLQSDGGILMKWALVGFADRLHSAGYAHGRDYGWMLNVHDEWQLEAPPAHAEEIGSLAVASIEEAGRQLEVRCPLTGEFKIGSNWAETH